MIQLRGTKPDGQDLFIQSPREPGDVAKFVRLAREWGLKNARVYVDNKLVTTEEKEE